VSTLVDTDLRTAIDLHRFWLHKTMHLRSGLTRATDGRDGEHWVGVHNGTEASVIWSIAREDDSHLWLHASLVLRGRLPGYESLCWLRDAFVGPDRIAYQVFAPADEHINIHAGALHLWAPLEHRPTPDFTRGTGSI
jgi:hypothetical protein